MTITPARFQRKNAGSSHSYWLTPAPTADNPNPEARKLPGVTTVIGLLDKPALVAWAAQQSADYAIEHWDELANKPIGERQRLIERARFTSNKKATTKGQTVHAMAEALQNGKPVETTDAVMLADIQALARLLDQWQIQPVATEVPLCNTTDLWAGTCDVIADIPKLGRVMLDFKTGKAIYDEIALQLAAYARANLRLEGDGAAATEQPPFDGINTTVGYGIHVRDGLAQIQPVRIDDDVYQSFLSLVDLWWHWAEPTAWANRGKDIYNSPIGDPLIYETTEAIQ